MRGPVKSIGPVEDGADAALRTHVIIDGLTRTAEARGFQRVEVETHDQRSNTRAELLFKLLIVKYT